MDSGNSATLEVLADAVAIQTFEHASRLIGNDAKLKTPLLQCREHFRDTRAQLEQVTGMGPGFQVLVYPAASCSIAVRETPDHGLIHARREAVDSVSIGSQPDLVVYLKAFTSNSGSNISIDGSFGRRFQIERSAYIKENGANHRKSRLRDWAGEPSTICFTL
jgi:hypothetical protein